MIPPPTPIKPRRRNGKLPTPLGWSDHRTRTVALNGWLAREDAVAAGTAAATDPVLLGLPDRETLLRALFQRFSTTLEGVLDVELELGEDTPYDAIRTAYRKAAAYRPGDWRALQREIDDPVVDELTQRQQARMARRAGVSPSEVAAVLAAVVDSNVVGLAPRARRRRVLPRVLARRAG